MQPGGTVNERYEILSELGRGGMGVVYRARHLRMQRDVAIKLFTAPLNHDTNARAQREAKSLAGVVHPNLVGVHSLETDNDGRLMLVFDYIAGKPLSYLISDKPLSLQEAVVLFQQLCLGLQALHDHNIIHRDIKPSNLLIADTADGAKHLTIIDFGLAKTTQSQKLTATGSVLGTPSYMSPEQFSCGTVGPQSDLYSAACVLFEMLCGKPPFENESPYMVANAHLTGTIPELPTHIAHAAALNEFFEKALAKDPKNRYQTATEMWEAFCAAESSVECIVAPHKNKQCKRNRRVASKLAVALLAACAIGAVGYVVCMKFFVSHDNTAEIDAIAATRLREIQAKTWDTKPRDFAGAVSNMRDLISYLKTLGNGGLETARVYRFYGKVLLERESNLPKDPDEAIRAFRTALDIIKENGRAQDRSVCMTELAWAYGLAGDWKDGLDCMREICVIRGRQPGELRTPDACKLTHFLQYNGMFDDLLTLFGERAETEVDKDQSAMNEIRRDVALAYLWKEHYEKAMSVVALNKYSEKDKPRAVLYDGRIPAMAYALLGEPKRSRESIRVVHKAFGKPEPLDQIDFYDGCEALNLVTEHKNDAAKGIIERIIAEDRHAPPRNIDGRLGIHQHMWNCWLCYKAARAMGDTELADLAGHQMHQAQRELELQGCIVRNAYLLP